MLFSLFLQCGDFLFSLFLRLRSFLDISGQISGKLPVALQVKWRDKALRIRESRGFPNLKDLVEFIERLAEAANDAVFGNGDETSRSVLRKYPRGVGGGGLAGNFSHLFPIQQLIPR